MIRMYKICDFCGAREENNFENWGTVEMEGSLVKWGHSSMDLCGQCMEEFITNTRKMYSAKQSGTIEDLPLFKDAKSRQTDTRGQGKKGVNTNK